MKHGGIFVRTSSGDRPWRRVRSVAWTALLVFHGAVHAAFPAVDVPGGARPGQLTLAACTLGQGDAAVDAECGTLVVLENRSDPASRMIALPVARVRARGAPEHPPVFNLNGGPGSSNLVGAPPPWLSATRDVVTVGYRGADGSTVLTMPSVRRALRRTDGDLLSEASIRSMSEAINADFASWSAEGVDLEGYGIVDVVADMEAAGRPWATRTSTW